ncbi:MAG TPA: GxxExxY protein [Flavobacteriales bacterium]|jgi:GxxExxY protein|nr:GxxExxY protein [Flavobacteriales bacterium]HQW31002.1 GxxExxY protein [Flavobacteriales bacterium]HQY02600.1 GxxExxY protein [Flavobacteriales bacterium]HQY79319.1 GxxExxY protein [Flavobacteriales bacterium]HRA16307.1 GxxExxY protein [Flavobacteriales bacterium]
MTLKEQIHADKMQEVEEEYLHAELTEAIIKAFYTVYNSLGYGFLEKVYENALYLELLNMGLTVVRQSPVTVYYQEKEVGQYYADLLVDDLVILELKAAETICKEHEYQLINYLKATKIEVGLLLNFGTKPQVKRKIFSNRRMC